MIHELRKELVKGGSPFVEVLFNRIRELPANMVGGQVVPAAEAEQIKEELFEFLREEALPTVIEEDLRFGLRILDDMAAFGMPQLEDLRAALEANYAALEAGAHKELIKEGSKKRLPRDIEQELRRQFPSRRKYNKVKQRLESLYLTRLTVGAEQLARSILILANGEAGTVEEIFESNFHGDPRDILVSATEADGSSNYGINCFLGDKNSDQ